MGHYAHTQRHGSDYTNRSYRKDWMSDEQWRQAIACLLGTAIPTDKEILAAFVNQLDTPHTRGEMYVYSSVPSVILEC